MLHRAGPPAFPTTNLLLRAATINGAEYLGIEQHLGSIGAGKLADLIILEMNLLEKIENSESARMTVINGVVYDADTMNQMSGQAFLPILPQKRTTTRQPKQGSRDLPKITIRWCKIRSSLAIPDQ